MKDCIARRIEVVLSYIHYKTPKKRRIPEGPAASLKVYLLIVVINCFPTLSAETSRTQAEQDFSRSSACENPYGREILQDSISSAVSLSPENSTSSAATSDESVNVSETDRTPLKRKSQDADQQHSQTGKRRSSSDSNTTDSFDMVASCPEHGIDFRLLCDTCENIGGKKKKTNRKHYDEKYRLKQKVTALQDELCVAKAMLEDKVNEQYLQYPKALQLFIHMANANGDDVPRQVNRF